MSEPSHDVSDRSDGTASVSGSALASASTNDQLQPDGDLSSEWTLIEPNLSLHPTLTTNLSHPAIDIDQARSTSPIAPQADLASHHPFNRKRNASATLSPEVQPATSPEIHPTASQIQLRKELNEQDIAFGEYIARVTSAEENFDSSTDDNSDTESLQSEDMTTNPETIRQELAENFMFIGSGYLNDPVNAEFREKIMKVMKSDRKSVVSEEEQMDFDLNYKTYKLANEATLSFMLVPIMMKPSLTAQDVDNEGQPFGEFKTRGFIQQGVITSVNRDFKAYCLPHRLMNLTNVPENMVKEHYDKTKALTTPRPDFAYGISEDKLPKEPSHILVSKDLREILATTPTRDVFLIWENKSGGGILMVSENQALRDVAVVIYAKRKLHRRTGRADTPGIDTDTFIYAATNDNGRLDFWVGYAWLPEDLSRVEFHMEKIGSIDFKLNEVEKDAKLLAGIRKPLHNIIEWGSITRMPALQRFYDDLWDSEAEVFERSLEKAREAAAKAEAEGKGGKRKKMG